MTFNHSVETLADKDLLLSFVSVCHYSHIELKSPSTPALVLNPKPNLTPQS